MSEHENGMDGLWQRQDPDQFGLKEVDLMTEMGSKVM